MSSGRILIVDDDAKVRTLLRNVFEGGGYAVDEADGAKMALSMVRENGFDLVSLDLQLGSDDGLETAREIRRFSDVPIVMVTGRNDVFDRVIGLELGADDYITKPFHVREVLARVRSVLRRSKGAPAGKVDEGEVAETEKSPAYVFDGLTIVPDRFELFDREGNLADLTTGDFKLLLVFLENAKRVLSRDRLMDLTGGTEWSPLDRTIDNQVARLRKKIERDPASPQIIKTVRGVGYTFACDVKRTQDGSPVSKK